MARLIFATADGEQAVELGRANTLGRHASNTIQLLDTSVSKAHCIIGMREIARRARPAEKRARTIRGIMFALRDLGSSNGTYLNGERIRCEQFLKHGDEIRLGATRARFDDGSGAPLPPPPVSPGALRTAPAPGKSALSALVTIRRSKNINAPNCTACANRRPWEETVAAVEANFETHGVRWPHFVIMHGKDLTCAAAIGASGRMDAGLFVVATDPCGSSAKHAKVFKTVEGFYVGLKRVLNDNAF